MIRRARCPSPPGPARGLVLAALLCLTVLGLAGPAPAADTAVAVRVKAGPALADYIGRTVRQKLAAGDGVRVCDRMFSFFVSIVALPLVADADNATIGYTLSVLVIEPLSADILAEHIPAETVRHLEPYFSHAGIVRDFKLFVTQEKRLEEVLDELASAVRAVVAAGSTREREGRPPPREPPQPRR
jgi:hypothetical protein